MSWPDIVASIAPELPVTVLFAAVMFIMLGIFVRYLDRWMTRFGSQTEVAAEKRQGQIINLLEKVLMANSEIDRKLADSNRDLAGVIERNTKMMDTRNTTEMQMVDALARMQATQVSITGQLQALADVMFAHAQDVAARPCQMEAPTRRTPRVPRARKAGL